MKKAELKFSRLELYKLVWEQPISKLSNQLEVKESLIRQKCREYNIPTPDSSYWTKIRFKKKVEILPLPENTENSDIITFTENISQEEQSLSIDDKVVVAKTLVPNTLLKLHPLVKNAQKAFLGNAKRYGTSNGLYDTDRDNLSIEVSPGSLDRSLLIFDTIIKSLSKKGYPIKVNEHGTVAIISDIEVPIRLREKTKRTIRKDSKYNWTEYDYFPTGNLIFVVELESWNRKEITDTQFVKLEDKIDKIIDEIIRQGIQEKNYRIESEIRRQEEKRQRELRAARIKKTNEELKKFKAIFTNIDRRNRANLIRDYLNKYEDYLASQNKLDSEKMEWFSWARKKIKWYDPFIEIEDELLEGIDRNNLEPIPEQHSWW